MLKCSPAPELKPPPPGLYWTDPRWTCTDYWPQVFLYPGVDWEAATQSHTSKAVYFQIPLTLGEETLNIPSSDCRRQISIAGSWVGWGRQRHQKLHHYPRHNQRPYHLQNYIYMKANDCFIWLGFHLRALGDRLCMARKAIILSFLKTHWAKHIDVTR
jgi:hypothetical protein